MISVIDNLDTENSQSCTQPTKQYGRLSTNGKSRSTSSGGLSLRDANSSQQSVMSATRKPKALHKLVEKEEDNIEHMPQVSTEKDDYAGIMPFDERPSAERLKRILQCPIGQQKENLDIFMPCPFSWNSDNNDDVNDHPTAQQITDDMKPCDLPDILYDEDIN